MTNMTEAEIKAVNKTCRSAGAVGGRALVPRVVDDILYKYMEPLRVLDFGAGKEAFHTKNMRARHVLHGHTIEAYDIGENFVEGLHYAPALIEHQGFDIVFSSNVLNILPTQDAIVGLLGSASFVLKLGGVFICNYPLSPRKSDVGIDRLDYLLSWSFGGKYPVRVGGTKQAPVWKVEKQ